MQELSNNLEPLNQPPNGTALKNRAGRGDPMRFLALVLLSGCACIRGELITPDKPCINGQVYCEDSKNVVYEGCEY